MRSSNLSPRPSEGTNKRPRREPESGPRRARPERAFLPGIALAAAVIVIDQLAKWWILETVMTPPRTIEVTSFFNLVLVWNRGVSFGMFSSANLNQWVLPVVAVVIVVALAVWLFRTRHLALGCAIGFVIGGAIGNVIDRLRFGAVVDFVDLHVGPYHWPAFNVADSMITVGAAMIVADALLGRGDQG